MRRLTSFVVIFFPFLSFNGATASESGFEPYLGLKEQFTLALPQGWFVQNQSRPAYAPHGVVTFSSASLRIDGKGETREQLVEKARRLGDQLDSGELASFFVDRYPAKAGMACDGFSKSATKQKVRVLTSATALGRGSQLIEPAHVEPIALGGCQGLKVLVRARTPEGSELMMLVYSLSDGQTTYDFALRNRKDFFEKNRPVFEKTIATLKITKVK